MNGPGIFDVMNKSNFFKKMKRNPLFPRFFCNPSGSFFLWVSSRIVSIFRKKYSPLIISKDQIKEAFELAYKANYRIEAHAIGDAAFEELIFGLENYEHCNRPVATHCQITNSKLLEKLKAY